MFVIGCLFLAMINRLSLFEGEILFFNGCSFKIYIKHNSVRVSNIMTLSSVEITIAAIVSVIDYKTYLRSSHKNSILELCNNSVIRK